MDKWPILFLGVILSLNVQSKIYHSEEQKFSWETLIKQSDIIWSFDFLPDGKIIFTERKGKARVFDPKSKQLTEITGLPAVFAQGQGGLMDIRVHPDFSRNSYIYLTYAAKVGEKATTALARAKLMGHELKNMEKLFSVHEANSHDIHFGSRIEFDGKGHVFITVGDRNDRSKVQDLNYHIGKILRLKEDGAVPADNPWAKKGGGKPEIWSYGHRNPQGLYYHAKSGELWACEFGPQGGDELHVIEAGKNYGWPVITYGEEYGGGPVGEGKTSHPDMEQPLHYWVPAISPSGMTIYLGDKYPRWQGNIFLASLATTHLRRLVLKDKKVVKEEKLLEDLGYRFRTVRTGPDGLIYSSSDEGILGRLLPQK